ncbi:hypothetical protein [Streptomyces roseicoloratus]|uniref:hypothetical protein n=1 Tax=Streptomyces roseicoloratus TaxID=2508722 RepID=UPI001009B4E3|nr:hypothetical protein [Streptomyces roseicoloratus]
MTDRTTYVSLAGLRGRGWNHAMVDALLGQADVQGRDPRRWTLAPVRLYLLARVEAVERTPEFAESATPAARGAAAERRRRAVLATIRAEPIEVPRLPAAELERRAVRHRHLLGARGPGGVAAGAMVRWQVGYLRHALSRYDALLDGLYGATGRAEAERLLRRRLYEAIAAAYPHLAHECRRRTEVER